MACFSLSDAEHLVGVGGGIVVSSPFGLPLVVMEPRPYTPESRQAESGSWYTQQHYVQSIASVLRVGAGGKKEAPATESHLASKN